MASAATKTATTTQPLHVLRGLLRILKRELPEELAKKAPASLSSSRGTPTRAFVLQQYRTSRQVSCPHETAHLRQLAADFLLLQKDLAERNRLYELDAGAEAVLTPKEMSRRAAARSGLQLPELDPTLV